MSISRHSVPQIGPIVASLTEERVVKDRETEKRETETLTQTDRRGEGTERGIGRWKETPERG